MSARNEAGPSYANGRIAHARILAAARSLFALHGYRSVSLREIAREAGMTHTGVTHHFRSKSHVLESVLEAMPTTFSADDALAPWSDEDLVREIGRLLAGAPDDVCVRLYVVLMSEAAGNPEHPAQAWLAERTAVHRREISAAIVRSTDLSVDDAEREAAAILALVNGLIIERLLTPRPDAEGPLREHIARSRSLAGSHSARERHPHPADPAASESSR